MPAEIIEIKNIIEFLKYSRVLDDYKTNICRGHAKIGWKLEPSIARIVNHKSWGDYGFRDWNNLEKTILVEFQKQSTPFMDFEPKDTIEWLVHAQHHGLPTVLLDWTTNPLKALFFAVCDKTYDVEDGEVFLANPNGYYTITDFSENELNLVSAITLFHSSYINQRILAQEGCFTIFPKPSGFKSFRTIPEIMNDDVEEIDDIIIEVRLVISHKYKESIRRELKKVGISHQTMFPGLDGITKSIVNDFRR